MDVISLNPPQKDDTDWEIDPVSDIEDYTIEKAQEILKRAEARLLEQAAAGDPKSGTQDSSSSRFRIPKLHANGVPEPYVQTDGDVARAEPARLIRKEHRELANRVRKVEDPVVVKRTVIEVSVIQSCCVFVREENFHSILTQISGPILGAILPR